MRERKVASPSRNESKSHALTCAHPHACAETAVGKADKLWARSPELHNLPLGSLCVAHPALFALMCRLGKFSKKKTSRTTAYRRLAPHSHNPRGSQHPPLGSVSYARDLAMRTRSKPPYNTEFLCMDHRTASLYSAMHTIDFEQNFGIYELVFVITEITPFRKY